MNPSLPEAQGALVQACRFDRSQISGNVQVIGILSGEPGRCPRPDVDIAQSHCQARLLQALMTLQRPEETRLLTQS